MIIFLFSVLEDQTASDHLKIYMFFYSPGENFKESAFSEEDAGSIPGSGGFPRGGNGNIFQYSFLENSMDRGAWQAAVHEVTKRSGHDRVAKHTTERQHGPHLGISYKYRFLGIIPVLLNESLHFNKLTR